MSWINPAVGDYVCVNGRVLKDPRNGLANAVWFRLRTPLGSYWANARLGSELHLLATMRDVKRAQPLARQFAQAALKDLLDSGRINALDITVSQPARTQLHLHISVELPTGETYSFQHFVSVGS